MKKWVSSLRSQLILLILLVFIPISILMINARLRERQRAALQVQNEALQIARASSMRQEGMIEAAHQLVTVLAQLPQVQNGDAEGCSALFSTLQQQYPFYTSLTVTTPAGDVFCSSAPLAQALNFADRDWFQEVVKTKGFVVSDYLVGRIGRKPIVVSAYPVLDADGELQAIVAAGMDLVWLNQIVAETELPVGSAMTVIDRNGTILARHPDGDAWVGESFSEAPLIETVLMENDEGSASARGLDNVQRLYAFSPLGETGAYIIVGFPEGRAYATANQTLAINLIGFGLVAVMSLGLAWLGGEYFIFRTARKLVGAARQLGSGDLEARTGIPHDESEFGEIAQAFDEMAETLQKHQEELDRAWTALARSELEYRSLTENALVGVLRTRRNGEILYANEAMAEMLRYASTEELVGENITPHYKSPQDRSALLEVLQAAGQVTNFEVELRTLDGQFRQMLMSVSLEGEVLSGMVIDITEKKQAELALIRRDNILEAVGVAAERFLREPSWEVNISEVLEKLGQATEVSRVYVFKNQSSPDGKFLTSRRYEWVAPGIRPQTDNPDLQNFPMQHAGGFTRWVEGMGQGEFIQGHVREFPESEGEILRAQDILSLVVIPVRVAQEWWGFIGFDSCLSEREWSPPEIEALRVAANTLGAAIQRTRTEREVRQHAARAEALARVAARLNAQLDLDAVLQAVCEETGFALDVQAASVSLYDPRRNWFALAESIGLPDEYHHEHRPVSRDIFDEFVRRFGPVIHLPDVQAHADLPNFELNTRHNIRTVVCTSMTRDHTLIGALYIYSFDEPRFFTEEEIALFRGLADHASQAIANARLFSEAQRHLAFVQALRKIDIAITSSFDLDLVLGIVLEQVMANLGVDAAGVLLLNSYTHTLEFAIGRGFRTREIEHSDLKMSDKYAGRAALERRLVSVHDLPNDMDFSRAPLVAGEGFACYHVVPLIVKGEIKGVLEVFHHSELDVDEEWQEQFKILAGQAAIAIGDIQLFHDIQRTNIELFTAYDATIEGWSHALDLRDKESEGHSQRVTELTLKLAEALGVRESERVHIRRGALLHDMGKLGVPDTILLKPGELTEDEWGIMQMHPRFAYDMLSPIVYLRPALDIPYCHHEKWDGTGYPRGLAGEQIPLAARIFAVVDVWDALRSDRPYRPAWSEEAARAYIREQSGKHFDPRIVEVFMEMIDNMPDGR